MTADELRAINERLKAIDVKGKGYVQVTERVKGFRELFPNGRIECEIVDLKDGVVTMKAYVSDDNGRLIATGYAQEKESSSYINKTSFIENCETSAVGRALGWVGIGVDGSMASADELANAITNQKKIKEEEEKEQKDAAKAAYPPREEMIRVISEKNLNDPDNITKILKWAGVQFLEDMPDEKLYTAYNKAVKK